MTRVSLQKEENILNSKNLSLGSLLGQSSRDVRKGKERVVPGDNSRVGNLGVDSLGEEGKEGKVAPTRAKGRSKCQPWKRRSKENQGERDAPGDEGDVGNVDVGSDEEGLLGENSLEDLVDTGDLLGVTLDGVRDLLGGEHLEVGSLFELIQVSKLNEMGREGTTRGGGDEPVQSRLPVQRTGRRATE